MEKLQLPKLSQRELILSAAIPLVSFGGTGLGMLLERSGLIPDAGTFYWGSVAASFLLGYLAWNKPRRDIVSVLSPLYAIIIFFLAVEVSPTVLLQLLFDASLTVLMVRLNIRFSTPLHKDDEEDPMEKLLYAYMNRITPYYRSVDATTGHEIAAAVLSFKFGIYQNSIGSAEKALARLKGEGAHNALRRALIIVRDRADKLQSSDIKAYSGTTFTADDIQYLPLSIPPDLIENQESYTLDNALVLCYAVAYLCSPDDGQRLDEHQNFVVQILNSYKEALDLAAQR